MENNLKLKTANERTDNVIQDAIDKIKDELDRRLSIIISEPNGVVRETMINNFLIDI